MGMRKGEDRARRALCSGAKGGRLRRAVRARAKEAVAARVRRNVRPAVERVAREAGRHPERVVFRVAVQGVVVAEGRELVGVAAAHQSVVAADDGDLVLAVRAVEPVLVALGEELVVAVVALEPVRKSASELGYCVDLLGPPRHRTDAVTTTTSRRWRGSSTPSSRRSYGDNIASMSWGARNLISTQVRKKRSADGVLRGFAATATTPSMAGF